MAKTVLLIDDEPDIKEYVRAILLDHGYRVREAEDMTDIVQIIAKHPPDLVLLDIMMPQRSGLSIYRELRSANQTRHIPVALISGMTTMKEVHEKGLQALVGQGSTDLPDGFIEKPIQIPNLLETVERLIQ